MTERSYQVSWKESGLKCSWSFHIGTDSEDILAFAASVSLNFIAKLRASEKLNPGSTT